MSRAEPLPLEILDRPGRVAAALPPVRRDMLRLLEQPLSASGLARELDMPRQTVNYHLRELEKEGLVALAEKRRQRGLTEHLFLRTARTFVIDPSLLGEAGEDPAFTRDRFSSAYLVAEAAQTIREVAVLRERAAAAERKLATFTLSADLRFASPADFREFSEELAEAVTRLAGRYVGRAARKGRAFRVVINGHPRLTKSAAESPRDRRAAAGAKAGTASGAGAGAPAGRKRRKKETRS